MLEFRLPSWCIVYSPLDFSVFVFGVLGIKGSARLAAAAEWTWKRRFQVSGARDAGGFITWGLDIELRGFERPAAVVAKWITQTSRSRSCVRLECVCMCAPDSGIFPTENFY